MPYTVTPALVTVTAWGELTAERRIPGALRVLVVGQSAGGGERADTVWVACWYAGLTRSGQLRDRATEHATAEDAVRCNPFSVGLAPRCPSRLPRGLVSPRPSHRRGGPVGTKPGAPPSRVAGRWHVCYLWTLTPGRGSGGLTADTWTTPSAAIPRSTAPPVDYRHLNREHLDRAQHVCEHLDRARHDRQQLYHGHLGPVLSTSAAPPSGPGSPTRSVRPTMRPRPGST